MTKMITSPFYTYCPTFFQWKCFVLVIFVCNYLGEPHIVAATWPCTYLLYQSVSVSVH